MSKNNITETTIPLTKGDNTDNSNSDLVKQRPLSSSFNELAGGNSIVRKDHELHYLKNYTSLTEYELIILRKTAFTNLRNQFRELSSQNNNNNNKNLSNEFHSANCLSSPVNKSYDDNLLPPSAVGNHNLASQNTISNSLSALNHNHNHNTIPGKDLRESIIKTLDNINRGRTSKKWKIFTKKDKKRAVFGVPLVTSLEYAFVYIDPTEKCNNKKIPIVVYECINFLRKNGLSKEGIFRVNGSERRINNSLKVFNETAGYGFGYDFEGMNVFDVASLLKLYIRQLPEPLIPYCLYTSFLDVIKYVPDTYDKIKAFQYLFVMLPSAHLILLEILLQFLSEIITHYEENHMNSHNLACIFAPNLLRSKESASTNNLLSLSSSDEYEVALQVVEFLINNKSHFFITSPEVKPFQLFNKFEKDASISVAGKITDIEGITSLSVSDFTTFQKNNALAKVSINNSMKQNIQNNSGNVANSSNNNNDSCNNSNNSITDNTNNSNNNIIIDKTSHLKNEIKIDSSSIKDDEFSSIESINSLQPYNPISISTSNMKVSNSLDKNLGCYKSLTNIKAKSEKDVIIKDADINSKARHPIIGSIDENGNNDSSSTLPSSNSNPVSSPLNITTKCKSNLENVRSHSEESYYTINTCPLVSTSLNRLNYLPIKNEEFYEYLARDNDTITSTIANEKVAITTEGSNKLKNNDYNYSIIKESQSITNNDTTTANIENNHQEVKSSSLVKKQDLDNNIDQPYPSNVLNLAQKNRENNISFLSPLSTPTQPILCIPPPPTTPPMI
ncbi:RhoGAP-domain-containing protein [Piromyces finnis]|uniref:RhoGAP-domain-containing protein n=1 Tax=Piromyces finnis TaxID=1754191 RepID=A0A1Y1VJA1_9FUNG|nr:RhoGAP-domain-containing protein [Piromyces finnis]|eukprot:ORX57101.1 RhoGAP-domain-containing protein [Piromyces finnis]